MGIFSYNLRSILEVKRKINGEEQDLDNEDQDDEQEPEDNQEPKNDEANDYNINDVEDDPESDEPEEGNDGQESEDPEENSEDDPEEGNDEANDYNMDGVEDDEDPDNTDEDLDSTEDGSSNEDEGSEDELKNLENDIFKDIPPEQMNIKIMELKKQYLEVYATITDVLTRTNKIPKTTQNLSVLEFIINKLIDLKEIVQFYLSNTFDTKSYVENMVNYQQYLATLNTINRLLKEISRKKENNT